MCTCHGDLYPKRRAAFLEWITKDKGDDAVCVFPSAPVFTRNNDVEHEYRQDSDLHYLTGFAEPSTCLVMDGKTKASSFFVRARDPDREIWDGPRFGVDGAKEHFAADEAFTIDKLEAELPKLFANKKRLYYRLGVNRQMDDKILEAIDRTRARAKLGITWPVEIIDPGTVLHEMRLFKTKDDLETDAQSGRHHRRGPHPRDARDKGRHARVPSRGDDPRDVPSARLGAGGLRQHRGLGSRTRRSSTTARITGR